MESLEEQVCDDDVLQEIMETKIQLNYEINKEEVCWEQRAKANWLHARDNNTKFFHKFVTQRKGINQIKSLENEVGQQMDSPDDMRE